MNTVFTPRITNLLAEMGFTRNEDKWTAHFYSDCTGNILLIEAVEQSLKSGLPILTFNCYDTESNLLGMYTLDQILISIEHDLTLVEPKSNKKYMATYKMVINVPVDMESVSVDKYMSIKEKYEYDTEIAIAERVARDKIEAILEVDGFEVTSIDPVITAEDRS